MSDLSQLLPLNAEERAICDARDEEVEGWLGRARMGDQAAKDRLCSWAYLTAFDYYQGKVRLERLFTRHDAEELTAEFFVEFEHTIPRMRSATHFTRRLLLAKLRRYLQRKRRQGERGGTHPDAERLGDAVPDVPEERPWEQWTDTEWYQYEATLQVLRETDPVTRTIVEHRVRGAAYPEIAQVVPLSEAALRMRVARFYKAVRERYALLTQ